MSFVFGLIALGIVYLFYLDRLTPVGRCCIPVDRRRPVRVHAGHRASCCRRCNAFFRDVQNVLRHVLRLWFYLSPARCTPLDADRDGHPQLYAILSLNPFAVLFEAYRAR